MNSIFGGVVAGRRARFQDDETVAAGKRADAAAARADREIAIRESEASTREEEAGYKRTLRPLAEEGLKAEVASRTIANENATQSGKFAATDAARRTEAYDYGKSRRGVKEKEEQLGIQSKEVELSARNQDIGTRASAERRAADIHSLKMQQAQRVKDFADKADFLEAAIDDQTTWQELQEQFPEVMKKGKFDNISDNMDGTVTFWVNDDASGEKVAKTYPKEKIHAEAERLRNRGAAELNPVTMYKPQRAATGKSAEQVAADSEQKKLIAVLKTTEAQIANLITNRRNLKKEDVADNDAEIRRLQDGMDAIKLKLNPSFVGMETSADRDLKAAEEELGNARKPRSWGRDPNPELISAAEDKIAAALERKKRVRAMADQDLGLKPEDTGTESKPVENDAGDTTQGPVYQQVKEAMEWLKANPDHPDAEGVRVTLRKKYNIKI